MSQGATGFAVTNKLPAAATQVLFGASASSVAAGLRYILLLANKVSSGTATPDTTSYDITSPDDGLTYGGPRSEIYIASKAIFAKNPRAKVKLIAVTEATGSKATATITVTGTCSGAGGNLYLYIHGVQITVGVSPGQTQNTIAANINAAIGAVQLDGKLCVTTGVATNVVTVTFAHNGLRGNTVKIRYIADTSIGTTTFTLSGATLSGGTGTDSVSAALTTASGNRYFYYTPAAVDQTALQAIQTQLLSLAQPTARKRACMITCVCDTLATATTTAQTWLNEVRAQVLWHNKAEDLPVQVAAGWSGARALAETNNPNQPLAAVWDNQGFTDLFGVANAQPNDADLVTDAQASSALDVGLTPIQARPGDRHCMVLRSITSHSLDTSSNPDVRTLDTNMQATPDAWADDVEAFVPSAFPAKVLFDDTDIGSDEIPDNATTPSAIKTALYSRAKKQWESAGRIKGLDADYASWDVSVAPSPAIGRANATLPIHPAPWFVQFSGQIRQLSPT